MTYKKLSQITLIDNWYRKIISKDFDIWNWIIYSFLVSKHSNWLEWTIIFPITKDKKVIYIKEFRVGIENYIYSFPMWALEQGLSYEENAKKELKEETWYFWWEIYEIWNTIVANYDETKIKYFFADNLEFDSQETETWEDIEVFTCSIEKFEEKIKSWVINCPLTITCFTLAKIKWYV